MITVRLYVTAYPMDFDDFNAFNPNTDFISVVQNKT